MTMIFMASHSTVFTVHHIKKKYPRVLESWCIVSGYHIDPKSLPATDGLPHPSLTGKDQCLMGTPSRFTEDQDP